MLLLDLLSQHYADFVHGPLLPPVGSKARARQRVLSLYPDGFCSYCGDPVDPARMTIDHVVPRSRRKGQAAYLVCVPSCVDCNNEKDDTSLLQFLLSRALQRDMLAQHEQRSRFWMRHAA